MLFKRLHRLVVTNKCSLHSSPRIKDSCVKEAVGKEIEVKGWVHGIRKLKEIIFIDLLDGSSCDPLQITLPKSKRPESLGYGSSLVAKGELGTAPNGRVELRASEASIVGPCQLHTGYPFDPKQEISPDYLRQHLHFRMRTRNFMTVMRLRDAANVAIGEHFRSRGYIGVSTPVLTSNDCEGAGEIFTAVPASSELIESMRKNQKQPRENIFFDEKAYLTVSGQLHLETFARSLSKVFCFGPTFRAENNISRLHLSEFYMLEIEVAFLDSIEDLADEAELAIKSVTEILFTKHAADFNSLKLAPPNFLDKKFARITYEEAVTIIQKCGNETINKIQFGSQLNKEQELFLVDYNGGIPVFVINWPKGSKPFYMKETEENPSLVSALDLLVPTVGELIGGSVREDNYEKLKEKLEGKNNLDWYLELRKYGNVTTAGFGMGFERYLQFLLNIPNIKDVIPIPRWPHNCKL